MLDYSVRKNLKNYLFKNKNVVGEWAFGKTESFCNKHNIDFVSIMLEACWYQKAFDCEIKNDQELTYTIL